MTTFVAVTGIGCSGTSAAAGVVHKMGCPMYLPGHSNEHPAWGGGLYEDQCFYGLFSETPANLDLAAREVERHRQEPYWGLKNTMLGRSLPWFLPLVHDEPKVIVVHRTLVASIYGRMKGNCAAVIGQRSSWADACKWAVKAKIELLDGVRRVAERGVDVFHLSFEHLVAEPDVYIEMLAEFTGLPITEGAVEHIQPELKTF